MKNTPAALGWLSSNAQDRLCFPARPHIAVELIRYPAEQLDNVGFFLGHGRMFHGR